MSRGTRIVILAKAPLAGRCKRRLGADIGVPVATRMARAQLIDTWTSVSAFVSAHGDLDLVLAQAGDPEEFPLLLPTPTILRQGDGDLGRRMATLVAGALSQRDRALLLGTDSPALPDGHLHAALKLLDDHDVVMGPHADGGFWCLGVRSGHQALWGNTWLDELDWTADATREQVLDRAARMGLSVGEAPGWFDVDRGDDLERLRDVLSHDADAAPETRKVLSAHDADEQPLSIVVVALNESIGLDYCLEGLAEQPGPLEIIVADGSSGDRSPERAAAAGATVVVSPPGRGRQLAAGAAASTGDPLLFLHADTTLPPGATTRVHETLADGRYEAGAFITRTVAEENLPNRAGPLLRLADLRSRWSRYPYGDQALFMTRQAYLAVGGFRPLPIFEDLDISRRLARRKPLARVSAEVRVSGRRIQVAPLRFACLARLLPVLFRLGVSPDTLARMYRPD